MDLINKRTLGDSFELLESTPDKSVDLILTDPPYDFLEDEIEYLTNQFYRICRGTTIVFSPPENQWTYPDQFLFWIKPISTKNTSKSYSRFVEMIFVYKHEEPVWNADRHWSQYTNVFTDLVDDASLHPYRKPPSLITRLIKNHSNPGQLILDPFSGSFVVAEMAQSLGRNFIAIEKDEKYFV